MKKASEGTDPAAIERALDELTSAQHKAAESLYKQGAGAAGGPGAGGGAGDAAGSGGTASGSSEPKGDVIDAEVVDEGKQ